MLEPCEAALPGNVLRVALDNRRILPGQNVAPARVEGHDVGPLDSDCPITVPLRLVLPSWILGQRWDPHRRQLPNECRRRPSIRRSKWATGRRTVQGCRPE